MSRVKEELDTTGYFDNREPDIDAIDEERYLQEKAAEEDKKFKEEEQDDSTLEELNG